jgi:L-histidine Nalpha-methyltransferase
MKNTCITTTPPDPTTTEITNFYNDVIKGLTSESKYLESKYFYDEKGDKLFQDIMNCPEYYPTDCEMEIFSGQSASLGDMLIAEGDAFDMIELGAGDATKSIHLLKYLIEQKAEFTYYPIDISQNVISYLNLTLPVSLPGIKIEGLNGEYLKMLKRATEISNNRKVILFLGSNIGNMQPSEVEVFCLEIRKHINTGDMIMIGADLKKNPKTILAAYNDERGLTRQFNLNFLTRINRELGGNFDLTQFDHFPTYDPKTGACESYLISLFNQVVTIGGEPISFKKDEYIYMEISQKFTTEMLEQFAINSGFRSVKNFFDSEKWFVDTVWVAI